MASVEEIQQKTGLEHLGIYRDPITGRVNIEIDKERKVTRDPVVKSTLDELNTPRNMGLTKRTKQAEAVLSILSSMGGMVAGGEDLAVFGGVAFAFQAARDFR